jgi:lipoprotein-anchoring transpeptidase ErfK/SrfK
MRNVFTAALLVALVCSLGAAGTASAELFKMKSANQMIGKQEKPKVYKEVEAELTPENMHVLVSLTKQRAYLMAGEKVFVDTPISSGKAGHSTPSGKYSVLEKDPNHRSTLYGDFVDKSGRTVRGGVSLKIDSAPSGTTYRGASMKWFMRLTNEGVGMHVGILPGYAASHGCVRLPEEMARLIYSKVKVGTPVAIVP